MAKDITDTSGPRLPWAGRKVRAEQVEEELSIFWRMAADNVRNSQNIQVRTSVLNLVICTPDVASAQQASAIIRDLSSTHVARVILLILDTTQGQPGTVSTWVTLRSFPVVSDTMRHNFEQITVMITGPAVRSAGNILQPLLKPQLPTYVWWLDDPPRDFAIFRSLTPLSNRIIVDSSTFSTPELSISTLPTLIDIAPDSALSDLNWGRITSWRQLVAQFFDVAEYKPYLTGVDSIEIEYAIPSVTDNTLAEQGAASTNPLCALLLGAWLTSRLEWRLSPDETHIQHGPSMGTYDWQMIRTLSSPKTRSTTGKLSTGKLSKQENVSYGHVHIRPRIETDMPPGSLCLIRLVSHIDNKYATFTINREDGPDHVLTSVELPQTTRPQRTVSMAANYVVSELLHDELEIMGRDQLYEETLREVAALLTQ